jgi:fructose-bisphosphate aldolase class I
MDGAQLERTAKQLVAPAKGILAADESMTTIERRFGSVQIPVTVENRQAYRQMFFTAPQIEQFLSGVILHDETIRQNAADGTSFPKLLQGRGILPGIKVDMGAHPLAGFPEEVVTEGLDGLRERLNEYRDSFGATFAKWRAVITIGPDRPTSFCMAANAHALARYAAMCQEAGIVPIVEPEVVMDGDHTIERCAEVSAQALTCMYDQMREQRVHLPGSLLKPNMIVSGKSCSVQADVKQVAEATVRILRDNVPPQVTGIVFLSGGQKPQPATAHLHAINTLGPHPWQISFSYARALQEPALDAWRGVAANVPEAQRLFQHRARCNSAARDGRYSEAMESVAAA